MLRLLAFRHHKPTGPNELGSDHGAAFRFGRRSSRSVIERAVPSRGSQAREALHFGVNRRRACDKRDMMCHSAKCILGPLLTERENLFTPIHKGIRSMTYEMGRRLGSTDFRDPLATHRMADELSANLPFVASNCFLCLLSVHSHHEEKDFFAPVRPHDEDVVEHLMKEHRSLQARVRVVASVCDDLQEESDPNRRVELSDRLQLELNDLFALSLSHMNDEESLLVPIMWEHFTDEQLRNLRAQFYNRIPLDRFQEWMRWTLPALNPDELRRLLSGMKADPAPNRFADAMRIAQERLPPDRWALVHSELGL